MLPFVYCCKEGLLGKKRMAQCDAFQSMLPTDNGNGYSPPVPGMGLPCLYYINLLWNVIAASIYLSLDIKTFPPCSLAVW